MSRQRIPPIRVFNGDFRAHFRMPSHAQDCREVVAERSSIEQHGNNADNYYNNGEEDRQSISEPEFDRRVDIYIVVCVDGDVSW